ncbi:hypothetical protein GYA93_18265 [Gordonia desulfuricans]|uniref:Immunity protein Imm1 n=1 Tax=Gordonia desulfuricans TaxID=89051 RepID=A0A7K3LVC1_9ACTN|nr:Imm1 family immunity protein [Gordonia desulfuricans]NDK91507.1 hypothetical protein [Gordonia desulfuricans]
MEHATVHDPGGIERLLVHLGLSSAVTGTPLQVDMMQVPLRSHEPLLVQFVIGDRARGSMLWHTDGQAFSAVEVGCGFSAAFLGFFSLVGGDAVEPEQARLRPETLRRLVVEMVRTGVRPSCVEWHEAPMD